MLITELAVLQETEEKGGTERKYLSNDKKSRSMRTAKRRVINLVGYRTRDENTHKRREKNREKNREKEKKEERPQVHQRYKEVANFYYSVCGM